MITIKKTSWHFRIQKYVLGYVPDHKGLCSYFWMTLACICLSPFIALINKVREFTQAIREYSARNHEKYLLSLDDEGLYKYYKTVDRWKFENDMHVLVRNRKGFHPGRIGKLMEKFAERYWNELQSKRKKLVRVEKISEKLAKFLSVVGKVLYYIFITFVVIVAAGVLYIAIQDIHTNGKWMEVLIIFASVAAFAVVLLTGAILYDGSTREFKKKFKAKITFPFRYTYRKFKATSDFIFENYCPRIEIED